ncbi:uncharacterized protein UHOD_12336 [Ustilago sp. UG-2017b]|nr:uncharacterized protein UHOD_12336 [Ustilago sp. UG-2017b]
MARLRVSPKDAPLRRSVIGRPAGAKVRGSPPECVCTRCRKSLPFSQFLSLSWPNTITQSCTTCKAQQAASLNTRNLCGRSTWATRAASYVSSVASTAVAPGSPAGPANTLAPDTAPEPRLGANLFVTVSLLEAQLQGVTTDITSSVMGPLCSLKHQVASLADTMAIRPPPGPSSAPAPIPHPSLPPASALPLTLRRPLTTLTVNAVYKDLLQPSDLSKLCNATAAMPVGEKVTLSVGAYELALTLPTPTPLAKTFLKAIPDLVAFCQAWSVYTALCAAASPDHTLGPGPVPDMTWRLSKTNSRLHPQSPPKLLPLPQSRRSQTPAPQCASAGTTTPAAATVAGVSGRAPETRLCASSLSQWDQLTQVFVALLLDALDVTWTAIRLWPTDDRRYWTAGVRHHLQLGTGPQVLRNTTYSLTSDSDTTHTYEMSLQSPAIAMIRN